MSSDLIEDGFFLGALALLGALSVIDLRVRLLPDRLVGAFALLGIFFHIATKWHYLAPNMLALGALAGFLPLYVIRFIANRIYRQDTLGLGDVKLLGAAGFWLGPDGVMMAMTLGALFGMAHGLGVAVYTAAKTRQKINLSQLEVPAGPGFALGIVLVGAWMFGFIHTGFSWPGH